MSIKIGILTIVKNEEYILPFFLRNYSPWVDAFFIYDNDSTDRTAEIIKGHPKTRCFTLKTDGLTCDSKMMAIKNEAHKLTEMDWMAVMDADELIPPMLETRIRTVVERADAAGADCVTSRIIELVSLSRPEDDGRSLLHDLVPHGILEPTRLDNGKGLIFKTGIPMQFSPGQHRFCAHRKVYAQRGTMFHARLLGWKHIVERCHKYKLSQENIDCNWGVAQRSETHMLEEWAYSTMNAKPWRDLDGDKEIKAWTV
jgi:glycosyltransferase involved in cell wall biosynthesis